MSSTFTTFPDKYDQTSVFGTKRKLPIYLQFVPGIVVRTAPSQDNVTYQRNLQNINSIIAMPHETHKGIKKPSEAGEEFRYYPLLRGIQETPTPGDPVLLCDFGGVQYYLGPLNTHGNPTFNTDKFKDNHIQFTFDKTVRSEGPIKSLLFDDTSFSRLQKPLNPILDTPWQPAFNMDPNVVGPPPPVEIIDDTVHGDLVLEGRHGNSIRIGSRYINPYIIISNGRSRDNRVETTLDGTILSITNSGTIRNHFKMNPIDIKSDEVYKFKLADDEIPEVYNSISKTFNKPLGHGGNSELQSDIPFNSDDKIYNYKDNQFFLSSDRITFNSKKESIFLSALKHIHVGCGSSMTFSTSRNIFTQAHEGIQTVTKGKYSLDADKVYIDGRKKIILGNPLLDPPDRIEPAVLGDSLVGQLSTMLWLMKEMCYITSKAIENRSLTGGSLRTMEEVINSINDTFGMVTLDPGGEYPQGLADLILSNKVKLKR